MFNDVDVHEMIVITMVSQMPWKSHGIPLDGLVDSPSEALRFAFVSKFILLHT